MKNTFLLTLLSTGIVTLRPKPWKYFPTSSLILSLPCCSEWCFTERLLGLFSQPSSWVCRLKQKDDQQTIHKYQSLCRTAAEFPHDCHSCCISPTASRLESAFSVLTTTELKGPQKTQVPELKLFIRTIQRKVPNILAPTQMNCEVATEAWRRSFASGKTMQNISRHPGDACNNISLQNNVSHSFP